MEKRRIKLISTATTGLGDDDELLAVCISEPGTPISSVRTMVKKIDDRDKVLKSQEYHQISPEKSHLGYEGKAFADALAEEMKDSVFFTYNPQFQTKFIGRLGLMPTLYNLPLFIKGAESRIMLFEDEASTLDAIQKTFAQRMGGTMSMNKLAAAHSVSQTAIELPVEFSCRALIVLWKYLQELPCLVQGTLL